MTKISPSRRFTADTAVILAERLEKIGKLEVSPDALAWWLRRVGKMLTASSDSNEETVSELCDQFDEAIAKATRP